MALTTYIILERVQAVGAERNGKELPPIEAGQEIEEADFVEVEGVESFEAFRKIGAENAHSTDQALRKAAEKHGGGYLVAVSERHWKGEEFEVETVTRVKAKSV